MIQHLKELIEWLKAYKKWYETNYGPQAQSGPGSNPPTPPPPPPIPGGGR